MIALFSEPKIIIYNLPYIYTYALADMNRSILVLMHIIIQPPSLYNSSMCFETWNYAVSLDPSMHTTNSNSITKSKYVSSFWESDIQSVPNDSTSWQRMNLITNLGLWADCYHSNSNVQSLSGQLHYGTACCQKYFLYQATAFLVSSHYSETLSLAGNSGL